jgi:hypothetical protein
MRRDKWYQIVIRKSRIWTEFANMKTVVRFFFTIVTEIMNYGFILCIYMISSIKASAATSA